MQLTGTIDKTKGILTVQIPLRAGKVSESGKTVTYAVLDRRGEPIIGATTTKGEQLVMSGLIFKRLNSDGTARAGAFKPFDGE